MYRTEHHRNGIYRVFDKDGKQVGWLDANDDFLPLTLEGRCLGVLKSRQTALGVLQAYRNGATHADAAALHSALGDMVV